MCKFFKNSEKKVIKVFASSLIILPFVLGCMFYAIGQKEDANMCFYLIGWTIPSFLSGYYLREQKKCQLPHAPENVVANQEPLGLQLEGQINEEFEMIAPVDLLPRIVK